MKKKLSVILFILVALLSNVVVSRVYAANFPINSNKIAILIKQINETSLRKYVSAKLSKEAKITSIHWEIVYFDKNTHNKSYNSSKNSAASLWGSYYMTNVRGSYESYAWQYSAIVSGGSGPITLHMSRTTTVSDSFHANVGINAKIVSVGVGFDVTRSREVSLRCDFPVPAGKYDSVEAHTIYDSYNYDTMYGSIFGSPYRVGSGTASKAVGIFYLTYTWSN